MTVAVNMPLTHRVTLLVTPGSLFGRQLLSGITQYMNSTRLSWDLFLEDDVVPVLENIESWKGDGLIADFNMPHVAAALRNFKGPLVAVGCSYHDESHYPPEVPYVASDNYQLIKQAYDHLIKAGLTRFAFFGLPPSPHTRWAQEREHAFRQLMKADGAAEEVHCGDNFSPTWSQAGAELIDWLKSLPKPVGVIAANDARARQLLQACIVSGIAVPEEIAVIGVDSDPVARTLTRVALSSVEQGTAMVGQHAAALLHQTLLGKRHGGVRVMVPPKGVTALASTQYPALKHPYVMQARYFIRQYACQGIKTDQVAHYVGVSRSTLEGHFRAELQHSVHDEILRFKLDAAKAMLADESMSIADVAVRAGFTTIQYMHQVFKRELECTPRAYRDRVLAGDDPS